MSRTDGNDLLTLSAAASTLFEFLASAADILSTSVRTATNSYVILCSNGDRLVGWNDVLLRETYMARSIQHKRYT